MCRCLVNVFPEERYSDWIRAVVEDRALTVQPRNLSVAAVIAFLSILHVMVWRNAPTFPMSCPPIASSVNVYLVSSSAKIAGKILYFIWKEFGIIFLIVFFFCNFPGVCCKTPLAMDKTTVEISVTKLIALAVLVNFDVLPVIVYPTASDVTLILIVQMRQMKWVAHNPTAP